MKKFLRLSLLSMLLMLSNSVMAQSTVIIDFDNDYATLFPTLAGVSSSESEDGNFTGVTMSTPIDGVYVIVSPDEDAKTPSRIWSAAPRLRMYSGTFTVVGNGITKIEFTASNTNFNMTPVEGTLDGKTWTGESDMVVFNVAKNTQINMITVTMGGSEVDPDDDDEGGLEYTSGNITETENQIVFDFTAVDTEENYEVTGQMVFDFVNDACTQASLTINYPSVEIAQKAYQEALEEAEEEGFENVTLNGKTVSAITTVQFAGMSKSAVKKLLELMLNDDVNMGTGTLEDPLSPSDANFVAGMMLEPGETTDESFYIKGKISSIKYTFSAQYGTATFYISEDGTTNDQFYCYGTYYLENKAWVDGYTQINVGDDVIVYGKLTNYNGTAETANKQAYIYSLNGQTKAENGETPDPNVQLITVAKALEIIDALENGKTTAETYQVKGYVISISEISTSFGNATFVMADNQSDQTGLTVFRAKGFDNEKITDENLFKVGDEVVIEGKLQKYVKNDVVTPEVSGGYFISINGATSGIDTVSAGTTNAVVYNLSGQRVQNPQKGLYIVNGRKVVIK